MPNASVIERESKEKPDRQDIHLQEDEIGSEQSVRVRRKASTLMQQLHEERNFEKQPADSPISTPRSNPQTPRATTIRGAGGLADRFAAGLGVKSREIRHLCHLSEPGFRHVGFCGQRGHSMGH